ncbi:MAG: hypothetical protein K1X94_17630 [Sandaracinaceae bacterium]|nr:hypothetical protein [Sandaracinaceae bacterium]
MSLSRFRVFIALTTLFSLAPTVAGGQQRPADVDERLPEDRREEERLIQEDRLLTEQLLNASHGSPTVVALRDELRGLDRALRGRQRPDDPSDESLALFIPAIAAAGAGIVTIIIGALSVAFHAAGCGISDDLDRVTGMPTSPCSRHDASPFWIGGGSALLGGIVLAATGLIVLTHGAPERERFERRDELRRQLRLWLNIETSPDSASVVLSGSL